MRTSRVVLAACLAASACAHAPQPEAVDPFYRLDTAADAELDPGRWPADGERLALRVQTIVRRSHPRGALLLTPELVVLPAQTGHVSLANQLAYVETFELDVSGGNAVADPVVSVIHEGVVVEFVVRPAASSRDRVWLAFRVQAGDVKQPIRTFDAVLEPPGDGYATLQLPALESVELTGVRTVELGAFTSLGTLPDPSGDGEMTVLVRVVPDALPAGLADDPTSDFPAPPFMPGGPEGRLDELLDLAWDADLADGVLVVDAMVMDAPLAAGASLLDAGVTAGELAGGRRLRRLAASVMPLPGTRLSSRLDESYLGDYEFEVGQSTYFAQPVVMHVAAGVEAEVLADGRLRLRWSRNTGFERFTFLGASNTPYAVEIPDPAEHERIVDLVPGTRIVPMAHFANGRTAAIRVTFTPAARLATQPER